MICLDTNAIIASINTPTSSVRARINRAIRHRIAVTVPMIVLFELWYGIAKSGRPQHNAETIANFLAGPIELLNFDAEDAREAGEIRAAVERLETPIGA